MSIRILDFLQFGNLVKRRMWSPFLMAATISYAANARNTTTTGKNNSQRYCWGSKQRQKVGLPRTPHVLPKEYLRPCAFLGRGSETPFKASVTFPSGAVLLGINVQHIWHTHIFFGSQPNSRCLSVFVFFYYYLFWCVIFYIKSTNKE